MFELSIYELTDKWWREEWSSRLLPRSSGVFIRFFHISLSLGKDTTISLTNLASPLFFIYLFFYISSLEKFVEHLSAFVRFLLFSYFAITNYHLCTLVPSSWFILRILSIQIFPLNFNLTCQRNANNNSCRDKFYSLIPFQKSMLRQYSFFTIFIYNRKFGKISFLICGNWIWFYFILFSKFLSSPFPTTIYVVFMVVQK